ncbi:hypothetical protein CANMA_001698 [Candida margitis]|uniref:uncharacterized protein n=1 Tax=Candida margitis TaxID=1775924 RepID=UPI0022274D2F|nr:uncharacterized protein CANMA_001698 [Candida margitis]KAI5969251.1 hypothetical protein CANMA_001698 [Candida margitis]
MSTAIPSIAAKVNESQLNEDIRRRDQKIDELESVILQLKMQQLKNDHEEDKKLFTLENTLHNINNKLNEVEVINVDLRNQLSLSQNIIEKKNEEIKKLKSALKEQQIGISRETLIFQHKLDDLQMQINQVSETRANSRAKIQSINYDLKRDVSRGEAENETTDKSQNTDLGNKEASI